MEFFLNISSFENFQIDSEIGWISKNNLIFTINNHYYIVNLKHKDLNLVKNDIQYGKQVISMSLFCSILTRTKKFNYMQA